DASAAPGRGLAPLTDAHANGAASLAANPPGRYAASPLGYDSPGVPTLRTSRGHAMIKELATGLGVTLENLFKKPFTVQYPEEKLEMFPRFRGLHILTRHADGLERCVGCELCAVACPADAIFVEAAENDPDQPSSHGER